VGWKAVARVLSDFAAMGGQPQEILVTLALQKDTPLRWVTGLYSGMKKCLAFHGGIIVGGETTSLPAGAPAVISIAGRGTVSSSQLVTRSGGKPGDALFVTGKLGGSIRGRHLTFTPRIAEADWLTKNFRLRAMMDLSDGLAKDLPRLAKMSGCGFRVMQEALPKNHGCTIAQALSDGEDYELLFSLSAHSAAQLINKWPFDLPLTKVGNLVSEKGDHLEGGWGHFDR
jgi:thiamine-monophosphate kinase